MTENEAIKVIEKNRPTSGYAMLNEALDIAINAIEKQIKKKPIADKLLNEYYACPVCRYCVGVDGCFDEYCPNCGQKIELGE